MIRPLLDAAVACVSRGELRVRHGTTVDGAASGLLVLTPGPIPTTDVYLRARVDGMPGLRVVDTLAMPATAEPAPAPGASVVVVRHAPGPWLGWLRCHRAQLAEVSLLMDDDMPAALRSPELPLGYAFRTALRHARTRRGLDDLCDRVWLSTPELCARYASWRPGLCPPLYVDGPGYAPENGASAPVYFYHGTRAHRAEIEWLVPVVREVQSRHPLAVFEVSGDAATARCFQGIPRVRVLPPMAWSSFLTLRARPGSAYRVGLAPCLPTRFNAARSHVKLFDITRLGAAGIYADRTPYRTAVRDGETGILCGDAAGEWTRAILGLLEDRPRVAAIAQAARLLAIAERDASRGWPPPRHDTG